MSFQTSNISVSSFNTIPSNSTILLQKVPNSKKRECKRDSIDSQETLVGLSDTVLEKKGDFNKVKAMEEKDRFDASLDDFFSGKASTSSRSSSPISTSYAKSDTDSSILSLNPSIISSWKSIGVDLRRCSIKSVPKCSPPQLSEEVNSFFGGSSSKSDKKEKKKLEKDEKKQRKREEKESRRAEFVRRLREEGWTE